MQLTFTDDEHALSSTLRKLFSNLCPPSLVREMKDPDSDGVPDRLWSALTAAGVFGLVIPPAEGGAGGGLFELGLVFAEAGRALCPTVVYDALYFTIALQRLGTPAQQRVLLPCLAEGRLRATAAICSPDDARDLRPVLTARRRGGGWLLNGAVPFVGNAATAQSVLVTARAGETGKTIGALVDPVRDGVRLDSLRTIAGDKQFRLELANYVLPDTDVLPGDGEALADDDLARVARTFVALQCMEMAGGTAAVLDRTVEYVKLREQFGRPIGSFQAVQHHIADMRIALEAATLTAAQAVWWLGKGEAADREVAIAKIHCSEAYKWATLTSHQLHGAIGFMRETDLHLWSERAKTTEIKWGTSDIAARWLQSALGLIGGSGFIQRTEIEGGNGGIRACSSGP